LALGSVGPVLIVSLSMKPFGLPETRPFMDDDGTFNILWLQSARLEDVESAISSFTQAQLQDLCDAQGLKVPLLPLNS
jgi:hypothetical protein